MFLGGDALGRLAIGQIQQAGQTTTVLTADPGAFAFTGNAASFTIKQAAAAGSFALTGFAAAFLVKQAAASGAFALTGSAASFRVYETALAGSFVFTGYDAREPLTENVEPGLFRFTGNDAPLTRTGFDYDVQQGGVGHYLYEREKAKQLAAITRPTPRPIDRRTMPRMVPLARPYSAPILPAPAAPPVQPDRMAAAAAQAQATKKRREIEAILLLAS